MRPSITYNDLKYRESTSSRCILSLDSNLASLQICYLLTYMQVFGFGQKHTFLPTCTFQTLPVDCQNFIAFTAALLCRICCAVKTVHANFSDRESKNVWTKDATKQRFPKTRTKGGGHHVLLFFIYALPLKIWSQT